MQPLRPLIAAPPLLLVLLLAACPLRALGIHHLNVHVGAKSKAQMTEIARRLPPAGDAFDSLTEGQRGAWTHDLRLSAAETLAALAAPKVSVTVDVKLVGFDGEGNEHLMVDHRDLSAHLRSLSEEIEAVALHPAPNRLLVKPSVEFRVHPAYFKLIGNINAALTSTIASTHASTEFTEHPTVLVNPSVVSNILDQDYTNTMMGSRSYTLYILNPKVTSSYMYAYDNEHRSCPGGVYVSQVHRYAFYDLSANITFYGPGPGGKGQVLSHSAPSLRHYRPEVAARAVVPDLAALAWGAARHLAWPPLHGADVAYAARVEVHIIYMHQDLLGAVAHLDKTHLEHELREAVGRAQHVEVFDHAEPFGSCPHCVAGYANALRVRTSKAHEAKEGAALQMTHYLDTQALEEWVREWRDVVLNGFGVTPPAGGHQGTLLLPVFVFDVAGTETVMIDGWRQAIPLPGGAVVAVRSGQQTVPTFFGCHAKQVHVDPQDLHRPIMASLLQAGWGVADTALSWSEATGRTWSFLWSLGPTPFGPLSAQPGLSWVQRDAMVRNLALLQLNATVGHAAALLEGFVKLGGPEVHVREFLTTEQMVQYHRRLGLLIFKLQEATTHLSRLEHADALALALSMAHDGAALHAVVRGAKAGMRVELTCHGAAARRRWWLLPGGAGLVCVGLVLWRLGRGSGNGKDRRGKFDHIY